MKVKFATGVNSYANPGVAILNMENIPKDATGNVDVDNLSISIISALHCSTALNNMDIPESQKKWVFRVHPFSK